MMTFHLLIVDDEPHVVDSLVALLERCAYDLEIHTAYRAQQALEVMHRVRIDMLITDIQMPGRDGLSLIQEVHQLWPACTSVILSAYSEFHYACQAIEQKVAGYILKTEEEPAIQARLCAILDQMEQNLRHQEWAASANALSATESVQQSYLIRLLHDARIDEARARAAVARCGFSAAGRRLIPVMALRRAGVEMDQGLLRRALQYYTGERVSHLVIAPLEVDCAFILLGTQEGANCISNALEMVQACLYATGGQEVAFLVAEEWTEDKPLRQVRHDLTRASQALREHFEMCIQTIDRSGAPSQITVDFLKSYIRAHIHDDLSLAHLAEVTGYNASYLSHVFSTETSEPLVRYIARKRMEAIRRLMSDSALTLDQIVGMTNFSSRAYFNSFVKRETGLSPKKYRAQLGTDLQHE